MRREKESVRGEPLRGQEEVSRTARSGALPDRAVGRTMSARESLPGFDDLAVPSPEVAQLPRTRRRAMLAAAQEIAACQRALEKVGRNIVGEVLRGHGTFYENEHYPPDDVFDRNTHSQYYYHTHRGIEGEHGHFHTFLRAAGMPRGVRPIDYRGRENWPQGDEVLSHLVGISMDGYGHAIGLFTANRWVTGDNWYPAPAVVRMLDRFAIDHAEPSWPTNRWITAMLRLFRPHVVALLHRRDEIARTWAATHPGSDVYEDRRLELTSWMPVSVEAETARLHASLCQ